jgi:hypothetical protein
VVAWFSDAGGNRAALPRRHQNTTNKKHNKQEHNKQKHNKQKTLQTKNTTNKNTTNKKAALHSRHKKTKTNLGNYCPIKCSVIELLSI